MTFDRDSASTDALLTDLYLDALLAGAVLNDPAQPALDPAARSAAQRLRRDLGRVHPSFRFEERLATRLAEAAVAMRIPVAAGGEDRVVAFRPTGSPTTDAAGDLPGDERPDHADPLDAGPVDPFRRSPAGRPLLIGGALTSAALSIAGAAWVAWRRGHPSRSRSPMVRAARHARRTSGRSAKRASARSGWGLD